jgi:hypothetical protein
MNFSKLLKIIIGFVAAVIILLYLYTTGTASPLDSLNHEKKASTGSLLRASASVETKLETTTQPDLSIFTIEKRISSVWIVRETKDTLQVLVFKKKDQPQFYHLPFSVSIDYQIPKKAAVRVLNRLGVSDHEVETLHIIRHGELVSEKIHDASSYVAVVNSEKANIVSEMANLWEDEYRWLNIVDISEIVEGTVSRSDIILSPIIHDDYPSAREFLEPFALTSGKNPVLCLGKPPSGWVKKKDREWPTERESK